MAEAAETPQDCESVGSQATKLLKNLQLCLNEKQFSDVTLIDAEREHSIDCHKVILSSGCGYFQKILDTEQDKNIIQIDAPDWSAVEEVIKYIYGGKLQLEGNNCYNMLQISVKWNMDGLTDILVDYVQDNLSDENVALYHQLASDEKLARLLTATDLYIREHFTSLGPHLSALSASSLAAIVRSTEINVPNEDTVFLVVKDWYDGQKRSDPGIYVLLHSLRFGEMSANFLLSTVIEHEMMRISPGKDILDMELVHRKKQQNQQEISQKKHSRNWEQRNRKKNKASGDIAEAVVQSPEILGNVRQKTKGAQNMTGGQNMTEGNELSKDSQELLVVVDVKYIAKFSIKSTAHVSYRHDKNVYIERNKGMIDNVRCSGDNGESLATARGNGRFENVQSYEDNEESFVITWGTQGEELVATTCMGWTYATFLGGGHSNKIEVPYKPKVVLFNPVTEVTRQIVSLPKSGKFHLHVTREYVYALWEDVFERCNISMEPVEWEILSHTKVQLYNNPIIFGDDSYLCVYGKVTRPDCKCGELLMGPAHEQSGIRRYFFKINCLHCRNQHLIEEGQYLHMYDFSTDKWTKVDNVPTELGSQSVVSHGEVIGFTGNQVNVYNIAAKRWRRYSAEPDKPLVPYSYEILEALNYQDQLHIRCRVERDQDIKGPDGEDQIETIEKNVLYKYDVTTHTVSETDVDLGQFQYPDIKCFCIQRE